MRRRECLIMMIDTMLITLKMALLKHGIRQTRMAVDLGWDPAKLSQIVNEIHRPTVAERKAIAAYLKVPEEGLFSEASSQASGCADRVGVDGSVPG